MTKVRVERTEEETPLDKKLFLRCIEVVETDKEVDPKIIQLVKSGADVNYVNTDNCMTPLIGAIVRKNIALAKYLLKNKADANYIGAISPGMSPCIPLVKAMEVGSEEMVKLLLDYGADKNKVCPISHLNAMEHGWNVFEGAPIFEVLLAYNPKSFVFIVGDHEVSNISELPF